MYSKHLMYTQTAQYSHTSQYFHTPDRGCLHEIENNFFQNISDWTKQISKTLTPNGVYIYIAWRNFFIVRVHVTVFTIKRHKGTSAARARGVFMVKILNTCILSILLYNLFRQTAQYLIYTAIIPYTGILAVFMEQKFKFSI